MFEAVVAKFLMRYLKEYIKTIKGNQMEMELWKGHAVFENLEILDGGVVDYRVGYQNKINNLYIHSGGSMTAYNMEYGKVTVDGGYFRFGDGIAKECEFEGVVAR